MNSCVQGGLPLGSIGLHEQGLWVGLLGCDDTIALSETYRSIKTFEECQARI
jgi:hypothetical protein